MVSQCEMEVEGDEQKRLRSRQIKLIAKKVQNLFKFKKFKFKFDQMTPLKVNAWPFLRQQLSLLIHQEA